MSSQTLNTTSILIDLNTDYTAVDKYVKSNTEHYQFLIDLNTDYTLKYTSTVPLISKKKNYSI